MRDSTANIVAALVVIALAVSSPTFAQDIENEQTFGDWTSHVRVDYIDVRKRIAIAETYRDKDMDAESENKIRLVLLCRNSLELELLFIFDSFEPSATDRSYRPEEALFRIDNNEPMTQVIQETYADLSLDTSYTWKMDVYRESPSARFIAEARAGNRLAFRTTFSGRTSGAHLFSLVGFDAASEVVLEECDYEARSRSESVADAKWRAGQQAMVNLDAGEPMAGQARLVALGTNVPLHPEPDGSTREHWLFEQLRLQRNGNRWRGGRHSAHRPRTW